MRFQHTKALHMDKLEEIEKEEEESTKGDRFVKERSPCFYGYEKKGGWGGFYQPR